MLLPLGLLLFWSILRDPGTHMWRWALLIYLVIETTFVHARETVLSMGAMAVVFVLLAARPRRHRTELVRIAGVLGLMAIVLLTYKEITLGLASHLDTHVSALTTASREAAMRLIDQRGLWSALVTEAPDALSTRISATAEISTQVATYPRLFVESWQRSTSLDQPSFIGRLFLPLALLVLPLYALRARSIAEISLAVLLVALGIVTASGLLELSLSALVGNPEVFLAFNIIFIAGLFVFSDVVCAAGATVAERCRHSRTGMAVMVTGTAVLLTASFALTRPADEARALLAPFWTPAFAWCLMGATLVAAGYRLVRLDLPLFATIRRYPATPLAFLVSCCLTMAVLMPAIRDSAVWRNNPFASEYPPDGFTGNLLNDYALLDASDRLDPAVYPIEVIRFLRERLPPNQTILSADSLALAMTTPHFFPIISVGGLVHPSWLPNGDYLRDFDRGEMMFAIRPYLADDRGRLALMTMLEEFRVDLLIVDPSESKDVRQAVDVDAGLRSLLRPVFESDGFLIYLVDATPFTAARARGRDRPVD